MKTVKFVSGPDGRRAIRWLIGGQIGLSRGYNFVPLAEAEVTDEDALILTDAAKTGGRVFEVVSGNAPLAAADPDAVTIPLTVERIWPKPATAKTGQ